MYIYSQQLGTMCLTNCIINYLYVCNQLFIEVPLSNFSWRIPYIFKTVSVNKHQSLFFIFITCSFHTLAPPSANPSNSSSHCIWEFMGDEGIWTEYQKPVSSSIYTQPNNIVKGKVHPKLKILWLIPHLHVVPNP